jgi:branched-chain amino acid transport system permease protein
VHFALGELASLALFVALVLLSGTGASTRADVPVAELVPALAAGIAVALVAGGLTYLAIVRPLAARGPLGWIGGMVAVAFALRAALAAAFPRPSYVFPDPIDFDRFGTGGVISLGGGATLQVRIFFVLGLGLLVAALAWWVLERTRFGRALEAVASDRMGARLSGLPVHGLLTAAFALVALLAAVAGLAFAPVAPVSTDTGSLIGLKGLVAAVLAGFGSPGRALAAGFALGVAEAAVSSASWLGPEFRDVIPLALVAVALALGRRGRDAAEVE